MPADTHDRTTTRLNRLVAIMLGIAAVLAIIAGVRSLGLAQTGELRTAPKPAPGVLAQPELERRAITVNECTDAKGRRVYSSEACANAARTTERKVEVTTVQLAPSPPSR
jgi:hypothetical protein